MPPLILFPFPLCTAFHYCRHVSFGLLQGFGRTFLEMAEIQGRNEFVEVSVMSEEWSGVGEHCHTDSDPFEQTFGQAEMH